MHDLIIIGGGLAGLTAAIHLSREGREVVLFEKEEFPHHKVCGEYLSSEVLPYLNDLDLDLYELGPARIKKLQFSTREGREINAPLPLGGLGISRYALDFYLYQKALEAGVRILPQKVLEVAFAQRNFEVTTTAGTYRALQVFGAFGKRSILDKKLRRRFFNSPSQWVAIKQHYENQEFPEDMVGLHNFRGGYCGLSRTETGRVNVCYLASYKSFKRHGNAEDFLNHEIRRNPYLDRFFSRAEPIFDKPLAIAQISFSKKERTLDQMLMIGDAAALIHPLSGNGMAMAIHSGKLASEAYLNHLKDRQAMAAQYRKSWNRSFSRRLAAGMLLQRVLLNERASGISQRMLSMVPFLMPELIRMTHGKPIK